MNTEFHLVRINFLGEQNLGPVFGPSVALEQMADTVVALGERLELRDGSGRVQASLDMDGLAIF